MAVTTAALSGSITDLGLDIPVNYLSRVTLVIETNTNGSLLRDTSGNTLLAGAKRVTVDKSSGAFSQTLVTTNSADIQPADDRLYQATLIYPSGVPGAKNVTVQSGWFEFTAAASLADVWQGIEVTAVSSAVYASLTAMLAEATTQAAAAGDSADQAAASALEAAALVLSDLGTTDGQTRALIENPASQTAGALSATYVPANPDLLVTRDGGGRVTSTTENGITESYTRDGQGRVLTITRDGDTKTIERDGSGRVSEVA